MKYPMLISSLRFQKLPACHGYYAYDCLCSWGYILSSKYLEFACRLDGKTDPYSIDSTLTRSEVDKMLQELDRQELLRHERTVYKTRHTRYITLHVIKQPSRSIHSLARALNMILALMWIPAFLFALVNIGKCLECFGCSTIVQIIATIIPCTIVSACVHEMGHICAAFAYDVPVFEIGVMHWFLFPGMYVSIDSDQNHLHTAQINAAGLEANCLFAAACLFLSWVIPLERVWMSAMWVSVILVFTNALPIPGLDGCSILNDLKAAVRKKESSDRDVDHRAWRSADHKEEIQ